MLLVSCRYRLRQKSCGVRTKKAGQNRPDKGKRAGQDIAACRGPFRLLFVIKLSDMEGFAMTI